jgi:hypothetical protein
MATQSFPQNMFMKINKLDEFGVTPKNSQTIEFKRDVLMSRSGRQKKGGCKY